MARYIAKRLIYSVVTLLALITLTFFMMRMLPGDPFTGTKAITQVTRDALNKKYGLDKPVIVQYGIYLGNALRGDFGTSIHYNRPVTKIILQAFPYSFDLGIRSLIFAVIAGIFLGSLAAVKRGTKWDTISMIIAIIGVSIPSFIVGALLQWLLGLELNNFFKFLTSSGIHIFPTGYKLFPVQGWDTEISKLIPSFALGLGSLAIISRLMRTSMLDVLSSDYIKTAKAKGLSQVSITWKHAIRNALLPVITVLGPIAAAVLTGAFVVERIFNIPGMGKFFILSIQVQDYPMIAGTTLFYGIFLIVCNLLVDIAYGFVDPRIRLSKPKES